MDIEVIREKKKAVESEIQRLLNDFQLSTQLQIRNIKVEAWNVTDSASTRHESITKVSLDIRF